MKSIIDKFIRFLESLRFTLTPNPFLLNGWFNYSFKCLEHRNYGDELNIYLLKNLLPTKNIFNVINTCRWATKNAINYLVIGSLIEEFTTANSIIWGAGAIEGGSHVLRNKPYEVKAVRGHLTREFLLKNQVDCPEVYGDPALLTPLIYNREVSKKYELGIIPHVSEINHPDVKRLEQVGVKVIRFDKYNDWHDVIDEIRSCRGIVSSSLHGLILSDAYSIPNAWISLNDDLLGGYFKFHDYFSGVHRDQNYPLKVNARISKDELLKQVSRWTPITFDPMPLIESAPWTLIFNIKDIYEIASYTKYNNSSL